MTEKKNSSQTKILTEKEFEEKFSTLIHQFTECLQKLSKDAIDHTPFYLMIFGIALILLAVFLKVEIQGHRLLNLEPSEFIVLIASAISLLFLVSIVRLYQYRKLQEIIREQQKLGEYLMRLQERATELFYEKSLTWQEIIKEQEKLAQNLKQLKKLVYKNSKRNTEKTDVTEGDNKPVLQQS